MTACFSFREFGQKGKAITEYRERWIRARQEIDNLYNIYIYFFVFVFSAFLVSYIASNVSPVWRIINRFIHTIFKFIATFPRAFFTFGDFSIKRSSENRYVDTADKRVPTRTFACLEVSRFLSAYYFEIDELPYCFHSFSKRNWSRRGHGIIREYFMSVLLVATCDYDDNRHWVINAVQFWYSRLTMWLWFQFSYTLQAITKHKRLL